MGRLGSKLSCQIFVSLLAQSAHACKRAQLRLWVCRTKLGCVLLLEMPKVPPMTQNAEQTSRSIPVTMASMT